MLSLIELSGSPFDVGRTLGRFGAEAAHAYLVHSSPWANVMAWRDTDAAAALKAMVTQHFPAIWQELEGLAEGLELPSEEVFLWNCRGDLWAMAPDGCTTVQWPTPAGPRITHNEDGDPGFAGYCGLGLFAPDDGPRFASFVYPASIPGHTFAVNEHGLAMTVNNLRSRQVSAGVPRMVLTRALINQPNMTAAENLLRTLPRAGGFHLSLAQAGHTDLLSIEFNAHAASVRIIRTPSLHANHAIHGDMSDFPQIITQSSLHRQRRGDALLQTLSAEQTLHDAGNPQPETSDGAPLHILADQANRAYPIFRDAPDDSDAENTLATADIHIGAQETSWEVYERPGQSARFELLNAQLR
ncbi:MAG TPA: C45 family peptidase [Burkholderiaceae bacterium]|nr:C45 family peptidase [Burkholderiaceae bacterium]